MTSGTLVDRVRDSVDFLKSRGVGEPVAAVVLGSGLSGALTLDDEVTVPFADVPGFPPGSVSGHDLRVAYGKVAGRPVLVLNGRVHYYEGVPLADVTFPVRVVKALGARWIALLNAAGGMNPTYRVGDLVLITDHINWMGDNPLIGPNEDALGPRFPDLSTVYDGRLIERAEAAARDASILTRRGVYVAVSGPPYETPAELRLLRSAGGDLVGMSTVPEAIVAAHAGLPVLGLSVVTDLAFPEQPEVLSHEAVVRAARDAVPSVGALLSGVIAAE